MKKLILALGVVAFGLTAMQSCSKKTDCVCTDKDGVSETLNMSGNKSAKKLACDAANTSWQIVGGSCKMK